MALNTNVFITLDDAKTALRQPQAADAILERKINALTLLFEKEVARKIKKQTLTGYRVDGNGRSSFRPPFLPVQSVTSIELRYSSGWGSFYDETVYKIITDTAAFTIINKKDIVLINEVFLWGISNVLLTMAVGYEDTDPEMSSYRDLLLTQLVYDFNRWDLYEVGAVSKTFQDGSVSYSPPTILIKEVRDGLSMLAEKVV